MRKALAIYKKELVIYFATPHVTQWVRRATHLMRR